ncbi:STAS domain-containing protein [Pusillimonas sp. CC-YST705]|uniref:STAS domain-containing protein n=1 Tax=Mesopusillimonas faecipullorum TaxID=2755040 RepID=A0ABS8CAD1_9BURK|nr:SulP family inorganic anion transporter [Mesopusillimonas faecipullorum]MCB5362794.1 STAS domain-containing protein [Mesopusillimonas faecipullorum]
MIALVEAYRAGLLNKRYWYPNIVAGVIVGVVALPLAMAFAIASGVKPEQGLYTAIVAGLAVSVLGGSRVQIAGPTGAFIVILSGIVAQHGVQGLQIATLMAGVILVIFGVARLGIIIKYIPAPVIIGFTSGIGVIIWVGQWKDFFGLPPVQATHFHEKIWAMIQVFPQLSVVTTLMALGSLLIVLYVSRLPRMRRMPGPLAALVIATLVQSVFQFESVATIGSTFGEIPRGLPSLQWPPLTFERVISLVGPAFAIAMLGAIESLLSAVVADGMSGTRHHSNQELIGQGVANMLTPLFGGIAATGAIARTATNVRNGGTSPLAGIVHALTLILIVVALAPYAANVPLAALAAILFVVAWNMSEARHFLRMARQAPRADVFVLFLTFLLTVFADLVVAVNIGVIVAMLLFLRRMAGSVKVVQHDEARIARELAYVGFSGLPPQVVVYGIEGPLFYGAAENVERVLSELQPLPRVLIVRFSHVPFIDATGFRALEDAIASLQRQKVRVIFCEMNRSIRGRFEKMRLEARIGPQNIAETINQALDRARE